MSYVPLLWKDLRTEVQENASVKKMADRIYSKSNSVPTVTAYVLGVRNFAKWAGVQADKLLTEDRDWPEVLNEYVAHLVSDQGLARASAIGALYGIKKWLSVNGALSTKDDAWERLDLPKRWNVAEDRLPTRNELKKILDAASMEDKVLVEVAIASGLRLGAILSTRLGQIEGLEAGGIASINVHPEQTKGRAGFTTFLTPEASATVKRYLEERTRRGEDLNGESPLIVPVRVADRWRKGVNHHLSWRSAEQRWEDLLERAGLDQKGEGGKKKWNLLRFHCLRKYFKSWAAMSGVPEAQVEFQMGHRSSIGQTYFMPGTRPSAEVLDRMKAEYAKALPALEVLNEGEKVKVLEAKLDEQARQLKAERERFEAEKSGWENRFKEVLERLDRAELAQTKGR